MLTIKVEKETLDAIEKDYLDFIVDRNVGYIIFVARKNDLIITAYDNNKKANFKVTFQGPNALEIASNYSNESFSKNQKAKLSKESPYFIDVNEQIGSDEVGTGDFLGPVVVCSAYVDAETMKIISEIGITDSKKVSDKKIMQFVPLILKKVYYECKVLSIDKYNDAYNKGFNLNSIKAILHNYVLLKLHKRFPYVENIYVDQFCSEKKFYEYLECVSTKEKSIIFKEKGETYFPSVALASCLARYFFLKEIEIINKKYDVNIPLGAGENVDKFANAFVRKYGIEEFDKIAKRSFANYKKLDY